MAAAWAVLTALAFPAVFPVALPAAVVDFDDVAELFRLRCAGCHHAGGPAPFALENFEQARAWASSIRRAVASEAMPPWHADPRYGRFANDRRLPAAEKEKLLAWIGGGSLPGDRAAASALEAPDVAAERSASTLGSAAGQVDSASGWRIGVPDLVYELPQEVTIPAAGEVPYHGYRVETGLAEDVWIQAAETQPGNAAVVHHVIVQALPGSGLARMPAPGQRPDPGSGATAASVGDPRTAGDLGGYAPGAGPLVMPADVGRRLPAGAVIDFQMHYTPTGREETDRSRIGLVLAAEPPHHESRTALCSTPFLWIPAGERDVRFEAELVFPRESRLLSLRPHMHLRGDTFEFRAEYPDGSSEILLRVDGYDFNWQTTYRLTEPKPMPAGTKLRCIATYDNSSGNASNPDPTRDVSWGRETTDEMMIGFVDYYQVE